MHILHMKFRTFHCHRKIAIAWQSKPDSFGARARKTENRFNSNNGCHILYVILIHHRFGKHWIGKKTSTCERRTLTTKTSFTLVLLLSNQSSNRTKSFHRFITKPT